MGLDNGICIRRTPELDVIPELMIFNLDWNKEHMYDLEVYFYDSY